MTLCKFYLQGNCRFGNTCRFEHREPRPHESEYNEWRRNNPTSFGGQANTFGGANADDSHATRKGWSEQIIYDNLKTERPSWPFTSFGAPFFRSLIQADLSFEEYHFAAVEANRNGNLANWQQECDQRATEIKQQEENVLRNIRQAWQYNVNEPYYPSGKLEERATGGATAGGTQSTFGGGGTQNVFGNTNQSGFGGATSAFGKPTSSFGSSPFGAMPASAFTLGSRDSGTSNTPSAFGSTPSAFGNTTSTPAFGQPQPAFGSTTPSGFGQSTPAFAAKPSILGSSSLPPPPTMSSTLNANQPTFGQPSILGASTLSSGSSFASSTPTFGQPSILGAMSSTPAFGQASSFSSPFAGGLGRALSGTTGGGATFGAKSSFGAFAQTNQPNAFAQAAGLGGQNGFMQGAGQGRGFTATGQQQQQGGGVFGDNGGNRFQVLSEVAASAATGDKDDDMADEPSPAVDRAPGFGNMQRSMDTPTVQPVPAPPPNPTASPSTLSSQATSAAQPPLAFGSQPTSTEPPKPTPPIQQPPQPSQQGQSAPTRSVRSVIKSAIDEMAAWMADRFTIGQIPENEPPLEVR